MPDYAALLDRVQEMEKEIRALKRKVDNLERAHRRRWGVTKYGDEIKLPKG